MDYFNRHLEARLQRHTELFKTVLLAGARQVGKSTLLQHVFPELRTVVFDPVQDLFGARADPDRFLETKASSRLSKHDSRGIRAFRETYPKAAPGVVVYGGQTGYALSEHAVAVPWKAI